MSVATVAATANGVELSLNMRCSGVGCTCWVLGRTGDAGCAGRSNYSAQRGNGLVGRRRPAGLASVRIAASARRTSSPRCGPGSICEWGTPGAPFDVSLAGLGQRGGDLAARGVASWGWLLA